MSFPKTFLLFLFIFAVERVSSAAIYGYFFYQQPPVAIPNTNSVDQATSTFNLPVELSEHDIPSLIPEEPKQEPIEPPVIVQQPPSSFTSIQQQNQVEKYNFEQNLFAQIKSSQLDNPRYWQPTAQDYFGIFSSLISALKIDDFIEFAQNFLLPEPEMDSSSSDDSNDELDKSGSSEDDSDLDEESEEEPADKKETDKEIDDETVLVGIEQDEYEILN